MKTQLRMDEAIVLNNVKPIRRGDILESTDPSAPSWLTRRFYDLGVLEMVTPSTKPPGFYVNYSQVLFYLAVLGAILGGFWWTYDRIADANYQRGISDAEKKQVEKQLNDMRKDVMILQEKKKAEEGK